MFRNRQCATYLKECFDCVSMSIVCCMHQWRASSIAVTTVEICSFFSQNRNDICMTTLSCKYCQCVAYFRCLIFIHSLEECSQLNRVCLLYCSLTYCFSQFLACFVRRLWYGAGVIILIVRSVRSDVWVCQAHSNIDDCLPTTATNWAFECFSNQQNDARTAFGLTLAATGYISGYIDAVVTACCP